MQAQYNIDVRNRFGMLESINTNNDIQTTYNNLLNSIQETTTNLVGKIKRKNNNNWVSNDTISFFKQRNEAKINFKRNPTTKNKKTWHTLKEQLDTSYKNDKIKFLEDKLEQLKQAASSSQLPTTWSLITEISCKRRYNSPSKIRRTDETKINSTNELMNEWRTYFENLLNLKSDTFQGYEAISPTLEDLPVPQGLITIEEVEQAIKQLKNGKSPGLDYAITPEALKYEGKWITNQLCDICNDIYENQQTPTQFNTNIIIPIPKKGNKVFMTNYRGISLMSVTAKTYNRILLNRIRESFDSILRVNQAGFRKGRNGIDQIHIICRILEGAIDKQLPIFVIFVDFMKAFDSINRQVMFNILRHYDVPLKIVKAIEAIYHHSKSVVLVDGNVSDEFNVTAGVLQGNILAPFLFIIVIDYIMKNAQFDHANDEEEYRFITDERQSKQQPAATIHDLEFADDITLLESTIERAQLQLTKTAEWANKVGLQINAKKTQALTNQTTNSKTLKLDGHNIEWINNFRYLGSMTFSRETDIKARKSQAWKAFWKMKNIWKSTMIVIYLKINIFRATCLSVLLYVSETWIITGEVEKTLNSFTTSCYRIMLNIKQLNKISNNTVYKTVKQEPLTQTIQRRQLRFIGHCLRRNTNELSNIYAIYTPKAGHSKLKRGRPRFHYHGYIASLINNNRPPTTDEIRKTAANRERWSKIVVACKPCLFAVM